MGSMPSIGDYNDPNTFFYMWTTKSNIISTGWSNLKYDDLVKQAGETVNHEKRIELFKRAEQILLIEDAVVAPLAYRMKVTIRYKYLNKVMTPLFGAQDFKYAYTYGRE